MPIANTSFAVPLKTGGYRIVGQGQYVPVDDPIRKGREHLFDDDPVVETATARPGEKRTAKKPAAKKKPPADE